MKVLELFFNNEEKDEIYESWCFEPDSQQERGLGNLYLIAELEGQDSTSLNYLASEVSSAYSQNGNLKSAVKLANKRIAERGLTKLELAILLVEQDKLTLTKTDGIKVALLRNEEVINVGSKLKGNLTNIGTVRLKSGDKIIAITNQIWRKLRQRHLISKIAPIFKKQVIRKTLKKESEVPGATLVIITTPNLLQNFKEKCTEFFKYTGKIFASSIKAIKRRLPHFSHSDKLSFLNKKINTTWSEREARETPFLIALSYLLSFIVIRTTVSLVGSANSLVAQTVKESSSLTHFHIGRNIILFGYHIHHFYLGILLITVAGWLAITNSSRVSNRGLAIMYGIGLGLLIDEIGLLLTWGNYASSLSYLLGVLLLALLLNIIYFPSFWKKVRNKVIEKTFAPSWLNKTKKVIIKATDRVTGKV